MNVLTLSNCPLKENEGSGYVIINTMKCIEDFDNKVKIVGPESLSVFNFLGSRARIYRIIFGMAFWVLKNKIKKYDLIIFYGAECFLAVFIIKKILRIKTPILLHSNGIELLGSRLPSFTTKKWYHFNLDKFFMYTYNNVDAILTVSKEQYDFVVDDLKINNDKVFYINLALPDLYFESKKVTNKKKIITYCGGWLKRKGVFPMAEALETVLKKYPQYKFRLIGVGNDFKVNEHFSNNISNFIELIPYVNDKSKLMDLYKESEIFLFPSFFESFGLVIAEAMYCKCATITGPMGYASELENMEEAIIINDINAKTIIKALDVLINDQLLIQTLSRNGHLKTSKLTWKKYSLELNAVIEKVTQIN